jgi:hypothetical protein
LEVNNNKNQDKTNDKPKENSGTAPMNKHHKHINETKATQVRKITQSMMQTKSKKI